MNQQDKRSAARCKAVLAALLLLGAVLLYSGLQGSRQADEAGFSQDNAFALTGSLAGSLDALWSREIRPALQASPADPEALQSAFRDALYSVWPDTDRERLQQSLQGLSGEPLSERTAKLLSASYALSGPRIKAATRKALSGLPDPDRTAAMAALLRAVAGENPALPGSVEELCRDLNAEDRRDMLVQAFLTAANRNGELLPSDTVSELKKAARTDNMKATVWLWAAENRMNALTSFLCSNGKTVALFGILLLLDVIILFCWQLRDRLWQLDFKWLAILLIIDFLLVFQVLPMANMLYINFFPRGHFSLEAVTRLYTENLNLSALVNTLVTALCTMVLGTLLAFPLAWLVGRTNLYGRRFFRSLFVLTYMVPPYVGAMAWLRLLNPNAGSINLLLRGLFGLGDAPGPLNIYSVPGLIWVLTSFYYPYAFITLSRAMEKMDPSLEEASRIAGASPLKTVAKVTLPMMTPSLIAGALLVFVSAASCYGIPSIIGAPGRVHTVTTRIIDYVGRGADGMNEAVGLGIFLMALSVLILFLSDVLVARRQYITVSGKSVRPDIVDLGRWRKPATVLVSLFAVIVVLVPFATILSTSLKVDLGKSLLDAGNLTFRNWTTIFSRDEMLDCLKNSFLYAAAAATVGILVAVTMSYLLQRTQIRGRKIPDFLITLGSGMPSVVIALSLILSMRGSFGINIYMTAWILIIAYLIKYLMMGMRTVVSAMSQIHRSLEECSQVSGASWLRTMRRITGPLILPSIAAGWFLIFIPCFYELSMTTLLYSNGTKTIGFELYEYWTFTSQPMACAMAFAILLMVAGLNVLLNRLTKGEFSI